MIIPETPAGDSAAPNQTPQALIDIAIAAIRVGATSVTLARKRYDKETRLPGTWSLWLGFTEDDGYTRVSLEHIEYHLGDPLESIQTPPYVASLLAAGVEVPVVDTLIELFQDAAQNGWGLTHSRKLRQHRQALRLAEHRGISLDRALPMRHELSAVAINWNYDIEAHPPTNAWPYINTEVVISASLDPERRNIAWVNKASLEVPMDTVREALRTDVRLYQHPTPPDPQPTETEDSHD